METVNTTRLFHAEAFTDLVEEVLSAGTDNLGHFGCGYKLEGGLSLQQQPEEFAAAVIFLSRVLPFGERHMLEIGTASGGTARFLAEKLALTRVSICDDRSHKRAGEQEANFLAIEKSCGRYPTLCIGDSHGDMARAWITGLPAFDLAFVDGDHSYAGCKADVEMVWSKSKFLMLHDTVACEGVKRVWDELDGRFERLAHFVGEERPLGIGIARVK